MNPNSNSVQIEFSKVLLNFMDITIATEADIKANNHILQPAECYSIYPLKDYFEQMGLPIPDNIVHTFDCTPYMFRCEWSL